MSVQYSAASSSSDGGSVRAQLRTYLTRSHDGLKEQNTPSMSIATTMPLTSSGRTLSKAAASSLIGDAGASADVSGTTKKADTELTDQLKLAAHFPNLQVVADPGILDQATTLKQSSLAGIMQPYAFDIAVRSQDSAQTWAKAGIADSAWNAGTAHELANDMTALGTQGEQGTSDPNDTAGASSSSGTDAGAHAGSALKTLNVPSIAWEGAYSWDSKSLELAKRQGYTAVVAESAQQPAGATLISGRSSVNTQAGAVSVLVAEHTLSQLAQGKATSSAAEGETTSAGRLARFTAQSALDQMQRPYVGRTLLVSLGQSPDTAAASALLSTLQSADWITNSTLQDLLNQANGTATQDLTSGVSSDVSPTQARFDLGNVRPNSTERSKINQTLQSLSETSTAIDHLKSYVLKADVIKKDGTSNENDNPQALSRQNAKKTAGDKVTALQWLAKLRTAHQDVGLMAFGGPPAVRTAMSAGDAAFCDDLTNSVSVVPPHQINIFSASAQTPVNVKNQLPFPIAVHLQAQTDSNAITITPGKDVEVPAGSEAQSTFEISVVGTGSAAASFTPLDRSGQEFGTPTKSMIYSQIRLNDTSGNIFIIIALVLGALGIYRQATRKKDPNQ